MKYKLSEGELIALRDVAQEEMLNGAVERLGDYAADKCKGTPDEERERDHDRMMGAAEVYGALRGLELEFSTARGLPAPAESVEVDFTEGALEFLVDLWDEYRRMLPQQRGTVESSIDATARDTYLLYILDGVFGGES